METTDHVEDQPVPRGRFASLMIPEVGVRLTESGWTIRKTTETPYAGMCKARLGRSQYAVGDAREDGTLEVEWQWDAEEDDVGDDESVTAYLEVRP